MLRMQKKYFKISRNLQKWKILQLFELLENSSKFDFWKFLKEKKEKLQKFSVFCLDDDILFNDNNDEDENNDASNNDFDSKREKTQKNKISKIFYFARTLKKLSRIFQKKQEFSENILEFSIFQQFS